MASLLPLEKQGKRNFFVAIGGDIKEMKKNVYIPIGFCVAVSISKAGQELGEYTKILKIQAQL